MRVNIREVIPTYNISSSLLKKTPIRLKVYFFFSISYETCLALHQKRRACKVHKFTHKYKIANLCLKKIEGLYRFVATCRLFPVLNMLAIMM